MLKEEEEELEGVTKICMKLHADESMHKAQSSLFCHLAEFPEIKAWQWALLEGFSSFCALSHMVDTGEDLLGVLESNGIKFTVDSGRRLDECEDGKVGGQLVSQALEDAHSRKRKRHEHGTKGRKERKRERKKERRNEADPSLWLSEPNVVWNVDLEDCKACSSPMELASCLADWYTRKWQNACNP
eukprot:evm.model.scf_938.5 EVM.evm.TU.scf_938.5   scf_938:54117-56065(-)